MKKIFITTLVIMVFLSTFSIYQYFKFNDGKLHIIFCNVGEGDGIFIRTPSGLDILVDSGPDDSILSCLSNHMPFWDRSIELAILTHPHADHMRGFLSVIQRFEVKNFATESLINTTDLYKELLNRINHDGLNPKYLYAGDTFKTSDDFSFKILGPTKEFLNKTLNGVIKESSEDGSLLSLLTIGNFNAILTGDTPIEELKEAANNFTIPKISIFQISHHGSKYNSEENLLSELSPRLAVISVGKNNYGHPSDEVIRTLKDLKIDYLRTDQRGNIEIIADKNGQFIVR